VAFITLKGCRAIFKMEFITIVKRKGTALFGPAFVKKCIPSPLKNTLETKNFATA